ncbi:glycosyltransferase family 2 protein [Collimonas sp.]|jgi:glycosyltransferase involved in cell wall biosynthesis|uniref:glycosyltransferase family 2 protein n=1 Tax=Collimonas sp. TaxID=1963772 RepID=UPI002C0A3D5B|nr:glycosyltransferase family 2 protein [Collimonas sp.]HWX02709.1 glycosyltransferase family 2 protein [Collimonas sp.]
MPSDASPKVAILLCTYHGQRYLAEQLDSFAAQSYKSWEVWASDDCSRDKTQEILNSYQRKWGRDRLSIHSGPAEGFAANFLSLTCKKKIQAGYYAYSDQDDIWETDKLERAMNWLTSMPENIPAMYCSRTRLIDEKDRDIGLSPLFTKPPSFPNALMQNIGGGNTMVFNNAACELLREAGADIDVVTHDWWVYLVVSACGGRVFYDTYPSLRYRQHEGNLVGMNIGWRARLVRMSMLWHGRFRDYNDRNIRALGRLRHKITPENREIFDRFSISRNRGLYFRLIGIKQCGLYRQTTLGNLGLALAAIFKKF